MDQNLTQNLSQNIDTLFANLEDFTQKEGVLGKPVTYENKTFIPVVSVTLGYGGGNTQSKNQQNTAGATQGMNMNMGGGALGLGARVSTDAIVLIDNNNVSMLPISQKGGNLGQQMIDKLPQMFTNMNQTQQQGQGQQQNQ